MLGRLARSSEEDGTSNIDASCCKIAVLAAWTLPELGSGDSTGAQPAGVAIVGEQLAVAHPGGVAPGTFWLGQGSETN